LGGSIVVFGKTGRRYVKLNSQAQKIINGQDPLWNYKRDYVTHKFKKEVHAPLLIAEIEDFEL